jgi:hypothetical protein
VSIAVIFLQFNGKENSMITFMNPHFSTTHPGVGRLERVVQALQATTRFVESAKGLATLLLAALVATLMVVANEVIETWTDGHLLLAWIALWAVGFSMLAIFAHPIKAFVEGLSLQWHQWKAARHAQAEEDRMWQVAQQDPRLMAELRCAMQRAGD